MTGLPLTAAILAAALGSGLIAGVFFAFSSFVMAGLARLPAAQGIAAMQSINATVLNTWFFTAFFGTAGVAVLAVVISIVVNGVGTASNGWSIAGAALYLIGVVGVTGLGNVPRNKALAAEVADSPSGQALWPRYLSAWTAWNHVRTAAALLATVAFIMAIKFTP